MKRAGGLVAFAVAILAAGCAVSARATERTAEPAAGNAASMSPTTAEARLLALVNSERATRGERPLAWDTTLCAAGRQHSREMADLGYFDHKSPIRGLETPADRWESSNHSTPAEYTIGENLFFGSVADVAWSHRSLMASPDHRANILNGDFRRMGAGVYISPRGEMWVTEMFVS